MGHCCIGTGKGLMTCHNSERDCRSRVAHRPAFAAAHSDRTSVPLLLRADNHKDIAPGGKYYPVNAIYRHVAPGTATDDDTPGFYLRHAHQ